MYSNRWDERYQGEDLMWAATPDQSVVCDRSVVSGVDGLTAVWSAEQGRRPTRSPRPDRPRVK